MIRLLLVLAATAIVAPRVEAGEKYVYGPAPDWTRYKQLGEAAIRAKLPDAERWSIEWPNGYTPAGWIKPNVRGYLTCGTLRAVAPVTDRDPVTGFAIVIDQDVVKNLDISTRARNSPVNLLCPELVRKGKLPPAALLEAPRDTVIATLGITVRVMGQGAYVVTAPANAATELKPGMVINRVNGIALAGLGAAMVKVLDSDAPTLALETATGERIAMTPVR